MWVWPLTQWPLSKLTTVTLKERPATQRGEFIQVYLKVFILFKAMSGCGTRLLVWNLGLLSDSANYPHPCCLGFSPHTKKGLDKSFVTTWFTLNSLKEKCSIVATWLFWISGLKKMSRKLYSFQNCSQTLYTHNCVFPFMVGYPGAPIYRKQKSHCEATRGRFVPR